MAELFIVTGAGLAIVSLLLGRSHRNKARLLRDVEPHALEVGKRCRVGGTVELPEGSEFAISTLLRQHTNPEAGQPTRWRDGQITLSSQPFTLVLESGERVRCLLGEDFELERPDVVAKRGKTIPVKPLTRHLLHHVREGKPLFIEGTLEQEDSMHVEDYRGGVGKTWLLRSTQEDPARVSTEPMSTPNGFLITKHRELVFYYFAIAICLLMACLAGGGTLAVEGSRFAPSTETTNIVLTITAFALVTAFILALSMLSTRLKLRAAEQRNVLEQTKR